MLHELSEQYRALDLLIVPSPILNQDGTAFPDVDVNVRAYASSLRIGLVRECTGAGMVVIGGREPGRLHGLFIPGPEGDLVRSGCARIAIVRDMSARQHASRLARGVSQG